MRILHQNLVVQYADEKHQQHAAHDPIDLLDIQGSALSGRELGPVCAAIDLGDAQQADEHGERQQQPIKVPEGNHAPHQSGPAVPTAAECVAFHALALPIFTNNVPPLMWSLPPTGFSPCSPSVTGALHKAAIGTEPGSALSLNNIGLLRRARCLSTYVLMTCAAARAAR